MSRGRSSAWNAGDGLIQRGLTRNVHFREVVDSQPVGAALPFRGRGFSLFNLCLPSRMGSGRGVLGVFFWAPPPWKQNAPARSGSGVFVVFVVLFLVLVLLCSCRRIEGSRSSHCLFSFLHCFSIKKKMTTTRRDDVCDHVCDDTSLQPPAPSDRRAGSRLCAMEQRNGIVSGFQARVRPATRRRSGSYFEL